MEPIPPICPRPRVQLQHLLHRYGYPLATTQGLHRRLCFATPSLPSALPAHLPPPACSHLTAPPHMHIHRSTPRDVARRLVHRATREGGVATLANLAPPPGKFDPRHRIRRARIVARRVRPLTIALTRLSSKAANTRSRVMRVQVGVAEVTMTPIIVTR